MVSPHLTIPLAILALAGLVHSDPNAPCYDPKGIRAPGYYPCDPTAYITTCCPQGWTCFSNSLCVVTTHSNAFPNLTLGDVVRGTCTNPLWANEICGDYCLEKDDANAKGDIAACGGNRFCCGHDFDDGTCDCSSDGGAFTVKPGRAQTILGVSDTSFTGSPTYVSPTRDQTVFTAVTTSAKTSTGQSTSGTGSRRTTSSATPSTASPSSRLTTTPPSSTPTGPQQNGTASAPGGGPSTALKIGLGVGIPLAVLAVAGGALWYILWYGRQKREHRGVQVGGSAGEWGTSDDLAENERAESPVLSRPAAAAPGMTQTRV
ncbi:hypothetical protein CONLIGDRAFT_691002 [Coniochaeta ligniaria NRRL 30616]|uniref:Mid2 domain-containing protein n=1 Tax=Coniochaeta ligniaria NRRL 30616 TaxID=1408157 RepID=A0A1J7ICN0_9PEZI|nr:hypothetical protein CONLIGDRAFT_691002 [Coniochaeta ligniaria NRRL 30616]